MVMSYSRLGFRGCLRYRPIGLSSAGKRSPLAGHHQCCGLACLVQDLKWQEGRGQVDDQKVPVWSDGLMNVKSLEQLRIQGKGLVEIPRFKSCMMSKSFSVQLDRRLPGQYAGERADHLTGSVP